MGTVTVRPIRGRRDLDAFIRLPFRLHRGTPWVPPLVVERRDFLSRDKNPFFDHAEAEYFVAERDGQVVGRITAQVDERWTQHNGGNDGMFGFFECEPAPETASALVETAAEWLRERGRERMVGPMDFTTNDECGLLIEGYDTHPMILEPWHPPYYRERVEGLGYGKTMDLLMWNLEMGELKQGDQFADAIHAVADKVESEHGITVRNMDKSRLEEEIGKFMEVYNAAWEKNWGFVPITDEEVAFQAKNLKQVLDAYANKDVQSAINVWHSDDNIDAHYNSLFRELLTYMIEDPRTISSCAHLLFIAKNLERIGDHGTNIAEYIHFLVTGEEIATQRPRADAETSD